MGDFGDLRLGRDKSPAYMNIETFDPFGDAGVGGNGFPAVAFLYP